MGYGISPTGSFDEDVHLRVRATCPCGHALDRDDVTYEPAGTVSLTRLAELSMLAAEQARCLCGAYENRRGTAYACYRIPAGPHLVAATTIKAGPADINLTVREGLPGERGDNGGYPLSSSELDAARQLGQPASVRAAWNEALFALTLGAQSAEFPCGPGMRATATTGHPHGASLDLAVLNLAEGSPSQWLPASAVHALHAGTISAVVHADPDIAERELLAEAARTGLTATPGAQRTLTVSVPGGLFTAPVRADRTLAAAVANGRLLRLQAGYALQQAAGRLRELDDNAHALIDHLRPVSATAGPDVLLMHFPDATIELDIAAYTDAGESDRARMLARWERLAA